MIDVATGTIRFDDGAAVGKETTRDELLASALGPTPEPKNSSSGPWSSVRLTPRAMDGIAFLFGAELSFYEQMLARISLWQIDPRESASWDDWSMDIERARQARNEAWLESVLGPPHESFPVGPPGGEYLAGKRYGFAWGQIVSGFDPRGASTYLTIIYDHRFGDAYVFSDKLPAAAVSALRDLDLTNYTANRVALDAAFAAVRYPEDGVEGAPPRADMLTPGQRALAELITELGLPVASSDRRMPRSKAFRRRWLGLDPAREIDEDLTFMLDGNERTEPAWRAILLLEAAGADCDALLAKVSIAERLAMWGAVKLAKPEDFDLKAEWFFDDRFIETMGAEGGAWAKAYADEFLAAPEPRQKDALWPIFMALIRARIPIEPRWDALFPLGFGAHHECLIECIAAVPEERRVAAILGAYYREPLTTSVKAVFDLLPIVPDPAIAQLVLRSIPLMSEPENIVIRRLKDAARSSPAVLAVIETFEASRSPRDQGP